MRIMVFLTISSSLNPVFIVENNQRLQQSGRGPLQDVLRLLSNDYVHTVWKKRMIQLFKAMMLWFSLFKILYECNYFLHSIFYTIQHDEIKDTIIMCIWCGRNERCYHLRTRYCGSVYLEYYASVVVIYTYTNTGKVTVHMKMT